MPDPDAGRDASGTPFNPGSDYLLRRTARHQPVSTLKTMDLRISKFFNVQHHRLEVIGDFFNLFNVNVVTTLNPNSGSDFGKPTDILGPRVFRIGGRWTFWVDLC